VCPCGSRNHTCITDVNDLGLDSGQGIEHHHQPHPEFAVQPSMLRLLWQYDSLLTISSTPSTTGGDLCAAIARDTSEQLRWYNRGHRIALDIARGLYFLHSHEVRYEAICGTVGLMEMSSGQEHASSIHAVLREECLLGMSALASCTSHSDAALLVLSAIAVLKHVSPLLPQVMHSDLKTKNVLLSNTMNAKISDVGLAQLVDAHSENAPVLAL
jgi:Protein tyrosine and serine/threonine kinase